VEESEYGPVLGVMLAGEQYEQGTTGTRVHPCRHAPDSAGGQRSRRRTPDGQNTAARKRPSRATRTTARSMGGGEKSVGSNVQSSDSQVCSPLAQAAGVDVEGITLLTRFHVIGLPAGKPSKRNQ
jgi:hypothetical protein